MILITYLFHKCINNKRIFWIFLISISILCLFIKLLQIFNLNWMTYFTLGLACCNNKFNIVNVRVNVGFFILSLFFACIYSPHVKPHYLPVGQLLRAFY